MIWKIDSTHSRVSFAIRVLGVTTTKGRFNVLRGQLFIDEQNPAGSWVKAEVDAASIDTHIRLRDTHLRSAAFFDAERYPTIVFESTKVEHVASQHYKVTGNLTLLGVTKTVTFDVTYGGQRPITGTLAGLTAKATINRHDFGLGQGMRLQFAACETAIVEIELEAVQEAVETREAVATGR